METITLIASDSITVFNATCAPQDTGVQVFILLNAGGCDSVVQVVTTLEAEEICHPMEIRRNVFVPNVFSPNADGINDLLVIFTGPDVTSTISYWRIFDRWGALVSESFDIRPGDPDAGWDGTFRGQPLNPGVYVWIAEVVWSDGVRDVLYGDVTLTR